MWLGGDRVAQATADQDFLLDLLNTTPLVRGVQADSLADQDSAREWLAGHGGDGTLAELREVRHARDLLQAVVRGDSPPGVLAPLLRGVSRVPALTASGVSWTLAVPPRRELAVRALLAWDALAADTPPRLRACANPDCRLFLIDRSKANAARWCSMTACGNRLKARRHYQRSRDGRPGHD
jgi:predicted RNA-binding Zn ribbon-like protein